MVQKLHKQKLVIHFLPKVVDVCRSWQENIDTIVDDYPNLHQMWCLEKLLKICS